MKNIIWKKVFKRFGFPYFVLDLSLDSYLRQMRKNIGWGYRDQLFILKNNIVESYCSTRDARSFEKFISNKDEKFIIKINKLIRRLVAISKKRLAKIERALNKKNDSNALVDLLARFHDAYQSVSSIYRFPTMVDFFYPVINKKIIKDCAFTKDICGHFFSYVNQVILKKFQNNISTLLKINSELVSYLNYQEITSALLRNKIGVGPRELGERTKFLILFGIDGKTKEMFAGKRALQTHKRLIFEENNIVGREIISGQVAKSSKTKIIGPVKIICSTDELQRLDKGVILIAPMTTVDYTPYIKDVSAIVTDEGGLTCHAAIVSRELGIPCVIGTKIATAVFHDGDLVEVDAVKGIVRKIK